jgi:hypothetical protein
VRPVMLLSTQTWVGLLHSRQTQYPANCVQKVLEKIPFLMSDYVNLAL